jgi:hypothetical protein
MKLLSVAVAAIVGLSCVGAQTVPVSGGETARQVLDQFLRRISPESASSSLARMIFRDSSRGKASRQGEAASTSSRTTTTSTRRSPRPAR